MHSVFRKVRQENLENCARIVYLKSITQTGRISGFGLSKIKDGSGPIVIVINGFLNQNETDTSEWERPLKSIWPDNPWYYLSWESKEINHVIRKTDLNIWSTAMEKAKTTGKVLGEVLTVHNNEYILCGHSLGARVIYFALDYLTAQNRAYVREAHLLGGAVGSETLKWKKAKKAVTERIVNYRSDNDGVLKYLYSTGTMFEDEPAGRHRIVMRNIVDIDMTSKVGGHSDYKKHFARFYPRNETQEESKGCKVKISFSHNKTNKNKRR